MFVVIVNSFVSIGIFGFVIAAMCLALNGNLWQMFLCLVAALMTLLLGATWSAFLADDMDSALGAFGMFATLATGLLFFFALNARTHRKS